MKKVLLFIIAVFVLSLQYSFAQGKAEATVYMRDGRVIQGILEQSNTGRYRITTADGKISYFTASEVKSIDRQQDGKTGGNNAPEPGESISGSRWFLEGGISYYYYNPGYENASFKNEPFKYASFEITGSWGRQFGSVFFLGGGAGFHYFPSGKFLREVNSLPEENALPKENIYAGGIIVPVFADIRINVPTSNHSFIPFFRLNVGGAIGRTAVAAATADGDDEEMKTNIFSGKIHIYEYIKPFVGFKFRNGSRNAITVQVGSPIFIGGLMSNGLSIKFGLEL